VPRVFVGNFDFEHELADARYVPPPHIQTIAADLVSSWIAVAESEDLIWSPTGLPKFDFAEFANLSGFSPRFIQHERDLPRGPDWEMVPWGWTDSVLKWGQARGWMCHAPPMDVVRQVNSRAFRWELESRLRIALPNSAVLTSSAQIISHIEQFAATHGTNAGWVLKANFGMSGRERQLGRGATITQPILNWANRRLIQSSAVVFEPWVDRVAEVGIQLEIPPQGAPRLLGILHLLSDAVGTYRGSRVQVPASDLECWQPAGAMALMIASEVQHAGYFGPLGIDAMQYTAADGSLQLRALQDLNARHTMGRLALGLRRFVRPGQVCDWLHDARLLPDTTATQSAPTTASITQITSRSWFVRQ
jgi:hypothetical protein